MKKLPMFRLVADEGKLITDGTVTGCVIDVAPDRDPDVFYEIDDGREEDIENSENIEDVNE